MDFISLFPLFAGFIGLTVGSFLNVVIHRLPRIMEREWQHQCAELRGEAPPAKETYNLATPRSKCPHCSHPIAVWENIPVISYLLLKGRCSSCKAGISPRYPIVEFTTALLSAWTAWHFGPTLATLGALVFLWSLVALTGIDFDTQLLPDSITLPLIWLGLIFNLFGTYTDLGSAVIGAVAGYLSLWTVYWLFKMATGKEGMGYGDFKLLAAIGAWLGWQILPMTILLSSLVGAVVGIALILLARRGRNVPIPFGPYLAAAGLLAMFWGQDLTQAYLRLL
ncbi:type 4 prepilin-like proteins leader peptide-processing enzyme [Azospira sp. I13]|uniref:prepilin peptidase n=1 Tax=Azospira sp. I13 TaxID=1765050 RepID=UPI000D4E7299|nr:A24 family peptidase [Azospira sp. I13]GBG01948.1 type 4 prepilin-like proteins leader peptide-processing enzyme [Azospira sp. I13]